MNAARPVAIALDQATRDRLKQLTIARGRSEHWLLHQAISQFVEREEARLSFRAAGLKAWEHYLVTGLHLAHDEAEAWIARLQAGELAGVPEGHN